MVIPEPSDHTTGRFDHPNPEKAEENNFKSNFMRMMGTFKEEMKNFLKEMEEKTNKNWKKLLNPLMKPKKPQRKNNQTGEANSSRLED